MLIPLFLCAEKENFTFLVRLFLKNNPREFAYLMAYGLLVNLNLLILRPALPQVNGSWLYLSLIGFVEWFSSGNAIIQVLVFLLIIFLLVRSFHQIFKQLNLFDRGNFLIPFSCFLLIGMFNRNLYYTPEFFASIFLLLMMDKMFQSYQQRKASAVFDAAVLLGIGTLIYPPMLCFFPLLFFNLLAVRAVQTQWREWALSIIGFLIPLYFLWAYLFLTDQTGSIFNNKELTALLAPATESGSGFWAFFPAFIVAIVFGIFVSVFFPHRYGQMTLFLKRHFSLLLTVFVSAVLMALLFGQPENAGFGSFIVALTPMLAFSFSRFRNIAKAEIIHVLLMLILIVYQFREWL